MTEEKSERIRELLEELKNRDEEKFANHQWTQEEINKILELTENSSENIDEKSEIEQETKIEEPAEQIEAELETVDSENNDIEEEFVGIDDVCETKEEIQEIDILQDNSDVPVDEKIKSLMNDVAPKKELELDEIKRKVKKKTFGFASAFKNISKKLSGAFKSNSDLEKNENFVEDDNDDKDFSDEDLIINEAEQDLFDEESDEPVYDQSPTISYSVEKPGIILKKGEATEDLEGAPILLSADDVLENESKRDSSSEGSIDYSEKIREAESEGQIVFNGFETENTENKPEQVEESDVEKELFEKRKEKIRKFTISDDDDLNDPYGVNSETDKIGALFATRDERPQRKINEDFNGIEYSQTKDSRRVHRYLLNQKKKSMNRIIELGIIMFLVLVIGISAASKTVVGGDGILTIFSSLVMISAALVVSNQSIVNSVELLKKKKVNLNSAISLAAIICFFQNLLMLILYFLDKDTVSVFSGAGVLLLLVSEINNYLVYSRTVDAMELCTGDNKDNLFSIEKISDDKDAVELAKNVNSKSPRIKYSCKTRFPSHLIEMCTSETSADKLSKIIIPISLILSTVVMIVAWAVNRDFAVGFAAFTVSFAVCIPSYGLILHQLPLRWVNKEFNASGGLVSCQEAVDELCRTNVVILDSKDLFDQKACVMHGFKDFKNVRIDDAMIYASAMVICSGGPLTGVFDQVVVSRRDLLPSVKSFSYEEKLGVSGWINNQRVILGNRALMINHNIQIPETIDEERYLIAGHEVIYLAVAHKLAAMMVVDYAPNEEIRPYLKKLRDSGVSVLVRNCDPNVTEEMISRCYDMRLNNIKILNSSSGRIFKKYKSRPKMSTRSLAIHDGTPYTFLKSLCYASELRKIFKISQIMSIIGILMGFLIMIVLAAIKVFCDLPAIFVIALIMITTSLYIGILKVLGLKS